MALGAGLLCVVALAAPPVPPPAALASDYVGPEVCATCHDDLAKNFADNPHSKMVLMHGDAGITCENCHGPGKAHVEGGGDVSKIFVFEKVRPAQVNSKCLQCHAGTHPNFLRSPHAKAGLSCISCHSIHGRNVQLPGQAAEKAVLEPARADILTPIPDFREKLLKAPQPMLCYECHGREQAQFEMPFHHPVPEGMVKCTDCHDVHGSFLPNNLRSTADQNWICTKCHMDVRGPFVYEHPVVKAEGCLACHSPHGSQNPRMLNVQNIKQLCEQCHSPVAGGTVHGMAVMEESGETCTNCHTAIHGSNFSNRFAR